MVWYVCMCMCTLKSISSYRILILSHIGGSDTTEGVGEVLCFRVIDFSQSRNSGFFEQVVFFRETAQAFGTQQHLRVKLI